MHEESRIQTFDGLHPVFAAMYFVAVLVMVMSALHPVYVGMSLVAGMAYNLRWRGAGRALRTLIWQIPLLIVIALLNPVFTQMGSTELLRVGQWALYGESLAYGATMGGLFVAAMQWFSNAAQVLTSDKIMALTGRFAPTVGLVITMTMRLVPQFVRRGRAIGGVRAACTSAGRAGSALAGRVRQTTVLMSWGMEDSLETADAMRSRGWAANRRRTTFVRSAFRAYDAAVCGLLVVLIVLCAVCQMQICGRFAFYPTLGTWGSPVLYLPYLVLLLVPCALEVTRR